MKPTRGRPRKSSPDDRSTESPPAKKKKLSVSSPSQSSPINKKRRLLLKYAKIGERKRKSALIGGQSTTTSSVASTSINDGASTSAKSPAKSASTSKSPAISKNKRRSKFYNKVCNEKPTELFRADLISAMTVSDNEPFNTQYDLVRLVDPWKREWNVGVQVPVRGGNRDLIESGVLDNSADGLTVLDHDQQRQDGGESDRRRHHQHEEVPDTPRFIEVDEDEALDELAAVSLANARALRSRGGRHQIEESPSTSKLARSSLKKCTTPKSSSKSPGSIASTSKSPALLQQEETSASSSIIDQQHRAGVRYELDDLDLRWMRLANVQMRDAWTPRFTLNEDQLETAMERLEIAYAMRVSDEQKSGSFVREQSDADAVCDVCRGGTSEVGNLLVFCERCNVCVHQHCYGIDRVPKGPWLCNPCKLNLVEPPACVLCPNRGGAFKPTKPMADRRWAHVSCAVWIPETGFANPQSKEPIKGLTKIPSERWNLECEICHEHVGACVQCDTKHCLASYHVTCAQRAGYKITYKDAVPDDDPTDVLENFCKKHTKDWIPPPQSLDESSSTSTSLVDYSGTSVFARAAFDFLGRQHEALVQLAHRTLLELAYADLEHVFDRCSTREIPIPFRRTIFYYWRTKRLASPERSLILDIDQGQMSMERHGEAAYVCRRLDNLLELRLNLERSRTALYMVEKRERLKRQWIGTAAEQFGLMSVAMDERDEQGNSSTASNEQQQPPAFNMADFLRAFPFGDMYDSWEPKSEKMKQLYDMFPPPATITKPKVGRPKKSTNQQGQSDERRGETSTTKSESTIRRAVKRESTPPPRNMERTRASAPHGLAKLDFTPRRVRGRTPGSAPRLNGQSGVGPAATSTPFPSPARSTRSDGAALAQLQRPTINRVDPPPLAYSTPQRNTDWDLSVRRMTKTEPTLTTSSSINKPAPSSPKFLRSRSFAERSGTPPMRRSRSPNKSSSGGSPLAAVNRPTTPGRSALRKWKTDDAWLKSVKPKRKVTFDVEDEDESEEDDEDEDEEDEEEDEKEEEESFAQNSTRKRVSRVH